jgi:Uma2 family endonuclease
MTAALMTAEALVSLSFQGKRSELVRGRLIISEPPGFAHGVIAARIAWHVMSFVYPRHLGVVIAAETGFTLARDPDTVRAPDVGFIRADRVPDPLPRGYSSIVPDLIVEVLSPDDRPGAVLSKVADWIEAGARLVWVIDPIRRAARVYRGDGSESYLSESESLDGEDVLAGLTIPLREIV